jgi:hypothetical protein
MANAKGKGHYCDVFGLGGSGLVLSVALIMGSGLSAGCQEKRCDRKHGQATEAHSGPNIEGAYVANRNPQDVVLIKRLSQQYYRVERAGWWVGVGIFDGKSYYGVFRYHDDRGRWAGVYGTHQAQVQPDGSFTVVGKNTIKARGTFNGVWIRKGQSSQ